MNTASSANCSTVTKSREGCFSPTILTLVSSTEAPSSLARSSICFCAKGVSVAPGQIALQVMPVVAVSSATALVNPTMPCFAEIGRAVQQECRDRSRMPSSA
eukprot:TRINITY_DN12038_c0_g1_i37.p2 TRINITY_DN12038_c0_g1~~TRINITY_DN12038_c0_g1_i37.p2  ORF type:complete len:102 (+),score=19.89 TRINITY_DN12038_c0_g1_i37:271-576(+)